MISLMAYHVGPGRSNGCVSKPPEALALSLSGQMISIQVAFRNTPYCIACILGTNEKRAKRDCVEEQRRRAFAIHECRSMDQRENWKDFGEESM